jgi:glucose-1-phosphate adenylyltransferase
MIGEGCILKNCQINHSVLGLRSRIGSGSVIDNALVMGADHYGSEQENSPFDTIAPVPLGIGNNCRIMKTIVDKNAHIGNDVQIFNKDRVQEADREEQGFYIRSGIIVTVKNAVIYDGTII